MAAPTPRRGITFAPTVQERSFNLNQPVISRVGNNTNAPLGNNTKMGPRGVVALEPNNSRLQSPYLHNIFFSPEEMAAQKIQAVRNVGKGINTTRKLRMNRENRNILKNYRRQILEHMKYYTNTGNENQLRLTRSQMAPISNKHLAVARANANLAKQEANAAWAAPPEQPPVLLLPKPTTARPARGPGSRGSYSTRKTRRTRRS